MAYGQNNAAQDKLPDSLVVRRLKFRGNDHVKTGTLESLVRTHTNREFLGIPGFTPWYFIWKLTRTFGEKPATLNYETAASDLQRIVRYYNSIGFLQASADTSYDIYGRHNHKVKVAFVIDEGKRSYIKSVSYSGMPDSAFQSHQKEKAFYKSSPLTEKQINDSTYKANTPYIIKKLDKERGRIINYLKDNGYAAATRDSITAYIKHDDKDKYHLHLLYRVKPGKKYRFGDLHIKLSGPGVNDTSITYPQKDTLSGKPYTRNNKKIFLQKQPSAHSRYSLLTDHILFKPGAVFNQKRYIASVNEFQNLDMMNVLRFGLSKSGSEPDLSDDTVPVYLKLQTLPRNAINLSVFGMRRYGYGSGAGLTYTNNNLFGKGEKLELSVKGSFEYVGQKKLQDLSSTFQNLETIKTRNKFFRSFQTQAKFSLPRLTFPFGGLNKYLGFSNSRTRYSLSYRRADRLLFNINANIKFNWQYQVQHNTRLSSTLDLLQLEVLDTHPSKPFQEALNQEFENNPVALQQILEDFRPQFSSLFQYTFRDINTDLIRRDYGYYSEYSFGLGGTIPYLIDRFAVTPGTIEGTLPSPVRFSKNNLAYSRYVKFTADYRRYFTLSPNSVFAVRGFGGYAQTYGKRKRIPLNQRFYAGGSNDIRGWALFTLGPGSIPFNKVAINGGQIKLLSQMELRQTFLRNFLSSNWMLAVFTDAGNVWYGPHENITSINNSIQTGNPNNSNINLEHGRFNLDNFYHQIAVGSGVGLRIDLNYLILRIDFAWRIHDLQRGWFNSKKVHFHFGIGQAF